MQTHVQAREVVVELPDDEMGTVPMHRWCRGYQQLRAQSAAAPKQRHNDEIGVLGLPAAEIARLGLRRVSTGRKTKGVAAQ